MDATTVGAKTEVRDEVPEAAATDDLVRLRLWGPITAAKAQRVRNLIQGYARMGDVRLLVDLEAVPVIDAHGIAALLDGLRAVKAHKDGMMALRVNPVVSRALKQSGTITAFPQIIEAA
ncbi:MAG: STAS domain-containing protein [Candidatus Methylomirabilia bacterium]